MWNTWTSLKQIRWNMTTWIKWLVISTKDVARIEENKNTEDNLIIFTGNSTDTILSWKKENNDDKKLFNTLTLSPDTELTFGNFLPLLVGFLFDKKQKR